MSRTRPRAAPPRAPRWVAEAPQLAGVFVAAGTADHALRRAKALALETLADVADHAELGDVDLADALHFIPPAHAARVEGPTARAALALEHHTPS